MAICAACFIRDVAGSLKLQTAAGALALKDCAAAYGLEGRLIPIPCALSAGCGMAWREPARNKQRLEAALAAEEVEYERVVPMTLQRVIFHKDFVDRWPETQGEASHKLNECLLANGGELMVLCPGRADKVNFPIAVKYASRGQSAKYSRRGHERHL